MKGGPGRGGDGSGGSGGEALSGGVAGGVVGVVVLPQAPDDLTPRAAEDAGGVLVAGAAGAGAIVDVGRPRVVAAAGVGQHAERLAQAVITRPAKLSAFGLAGLRSDGS